MTRREKSDAQLDAEAEARRRGLDLPAHEHGFDDPDSYPVPRFQPSPPPDAAPALSGLDALIADHRAHRRDDLSISRLVGRQPPTTRDPNTGVVHQHEASAVGMNMSARLYRLVESAPVGEFPWHGAFRMLRVECRRFHPYHRGPDVPYWRGSLCQELVRLVVIGPEKRILDRPMSVAEAAKILRYDNPEPVLRYAFAYIETVMDNARARAERRAREEVGAFSVFDGPLPRHHAVPGLHAIDCPQCRKRRDAA